LVAERPRLVEARLEPALRDERRHHGAADHCHDEDHLLALIDDTARPSLAARYGDPDRALTILHQPRLPDFVVASDVQVWVHVMMARQSPTPENIDAAVATIMDAVKPMHPPCLVQLMHQLIVPGRLDDASALADRLNGPVPDGKGIWFRNYMAPFLAAPRFTPFAYRQGLVGIWVDTGRWPEFCVE
jgi:hypothetical protein